MKAKYFLLSILILCSAHSFAASNTDTIKVWGNCEECKSKIEKAAKKAGATTANWNDSTYQLVINYDADKTSSLVIQNEIAAVGYDTQDVKATNEAYKKLPKCCQYKRDENIEMMQQ